VDGAELDAERLERRREPRHELVEAEDLADAVADPARDGLARGVADPDLVLECGERVVAELCQCREGGPQHLA
jgi:hypothetical protein